MEARRARALENELDSLKLKRPVSDASPALTNTLLSITGGSSPEPQKRGLEVGSRQSQSRRRAQSDITLTSHQRQGQPVDDRELDELRESHRVESALKSPFRHELQRALEAQKSPDWKHTLGYPDLPTEVDGAPAHAKATSLHASARRFSVWMLLCVLVIVLASLLLTQKQEISALSATLQRTASLAEDYRLRLEGCECASLDSAGGLSAQEFSTRKHTRKSKATGWNQGVKFKHRRWLAWLLSSLRKWTPEPVEQASDSVPCPPPPRGGSGKVPVASDDVETCSS